MSETTSEQQRLSPLDRLLESFPLGKVPLVMALLFILSALTIGIGGDRQGTRLSYWCFARTHYDDYVIAKRRFEAMHPGWQVEIKLMDSQSLSNRLTAAFVRGSGAPDASEIEINDIGRFFKGEAEEVPFEDLEQLGAQYGDEGWVERIVEARYAPWSYKGTHIRHSAGLAPGSDDVSHGSFHPVGLCRFSGGGANLGRLYPHRPAKSADPKK